MLRLICCSYVVNVVVVVLIVVAIHKGLVVWSIKVYLTLIEAITAVNLALTIP